MLWIRDVSSKRFALLGRGGDAGEATGKREPSAALFRQGKQVLFREFSLVPGR